MQDNFQKVVRYLIAMAAVFLVVCIIGIVRNWSVLSEAIGGNLSSVFVMFISIALIIYLISTIFRR